MQTKKQKKGHKKLYAVAIIAIVLVALVYVTIEQSGKWLVQDDNVNHVNWIVVLDGQSADLERSDFAAQMLKQGKADSVLILGRRIMRDKSNAEFYLQDFLQIGDFDSSKIFIARHDDPSTISEAFTIIPWLKQHKADSVLLLTSAASTYRVKRIFTKLSGAYPIYFTKDINNYRYNAKSWYTNRESRKEWLRGYASLAVSYFDIFNSGELSAQDSFYYKPIISAKDFFANNTIDIQSLLPAIQQKISPETLDSTENKESN